MNSLYFSLGALGIVACAYAYFAWQRAKHSRAFDAAFTAVLDTVTNNDTEAENRRLEGHIDNLRALLADIHAQGVNSASGTAKAMAAKAAGGMAK